MKTLRICTFILFALFIFSCGNHNRTLTSLQGAAITSTNTTQPQAQTLGDALAQLEAMPVPDGVKPEVFMQLKAALREALECRARACTAPMDIAGDAENGGVQAPALQRIVSTPPTGEANRVNDLGVIDNGDGTYSLTWHYRNLGDYNQDGIISVADITPLAVHYSETYIAEDDNSLIAVVDGSGNRKVDIADVTPIAMNFGVKCAGYDIDGSDSASGPYNFVQEISFSESTGDGRLVFTADIGVAQWDYYRVIPYDSSSARGGESAEVPIIAPHINSVTPTNGVSGRLVHFIAAKTGETPFNYDWNFGGGAKPNTSAESSPSVVLGVEGSYNARLTLTNTAGEDTYDFTLNVATSSDSPTVISVPSNKGATGTLNTISAVVTGTPPITYAWNFGGGATPNTSNLADPLVTLGAAGSYSANLTVANAYGSDSYNFSLMAELPPVITSLTPARGEEGEPITLAATVEGSPPFTYSWDFGGGATPNQSAEISPQVILGSAGSYNASLIVSNPYDSVEYDFVLKVGHPFITGVTPTQTISGNSATFTATVAGKEPLTFAWDFGGGATPNLSSDREPEVTMGAGGSHEASLTVTNLYGEFSFPFTLLVLAPNTIYIVPSVTSVNSGDTFVVTVYATSLDFALGYLNSVDMTFSANVAPDTASFNVGSAGGAMDFKDGFWSVVTDPLHRPATALFFMTPGHVQANISLLGSPPTGAPAGHSGALFNVKFTAHTAGVCNFSFVPAGTNYFDPSGATHDFTNLVGATVTIN